MSITVARQPAKLVDTAVMKTLRDFLQPFRQTTSTRTVPDCIGTLQHDELHCVQSL